MRALLLHLAIAAPAAAVWPEQKALDCKLRKFAHEYALSIRPGSDSSVIADGLELGSLCKQHRPEQATERDAAGGAAQLAAQRAIDEAELVGWVDPRGDDDADGSESHPHATVTRGLASLRARRRRGSSRAALVLAGGTHFVEETIVLTPADANLTIVAAPSGAGPSVLSGGVDLGTLSWKKEEGSLYSAKLPASAGVFDTLYQPSGRRAIRARHPNADPETTDPGQSGICVQASVDGYQCPGWIKQAKWGPAAPLKSQPQLHRVNSPSRANDSDFKDGTVFPYWQLGSGGNLDVFDPPLSFWGMEHPEAGALWNWLTSATYTKDNTSGISVAVDDANPPIVQAFHGGHWGGWTFAVNASSTSADGGLTLGFEKGGYQEARGSASGAESYIENAKGLLDSPREWWLDASSSTLYFMANGSAPAATGWVGSHLETVLHVAGSQDKPVVGHQLIGVTVTHTAPVFLKTYMASLSGGDWSLRPTGAVILEGTKDALISHAKFDGVGGNGVMISNFSRNATIADSEFVWVGESAIVSVGSTEKIDGIKGDQPRGNQILRNLIHEVGIFGKQTAGYVQAMSCQTTLKNNVMFNGPRAGINFLDGFGGGNLVQGNALWNWVRETGDHGPFNSWDRQAYLTDIRTGSPSLVPAQNHITQNLLFNSYSSTWPLDHDDGSCYYTDTKNFMVYGGYKNYLGHSKTVQDNLYVHPEWRAGSFGGNAGECVQDVGIGPTSGWGEEWSGNTCIFGGSKEHPAETTWVGDFGATPHQLSAGKNKYLVPTDTNVTLDVGGPKMTLADAQAKGVDVGSTVGDTPTDEEILAMGKALLGAQ